MANIFGNRHKEESLDENTVLLAGITAGTAFRITEKKFGFTPLSETPDLIQSCIKTACQMLAINPDEQSRTVIHMVALTFSMDDTGLAAEITDRYESGDKRIYSDEAQQMWDLALKKSKEVAGVFSKNGKS